MVAQGQTAGLIRAVTSLPVEEKFFGISLLLLESFLGVLAWRSTGSQQVLLILAGIFVFLVIVILVWLQRRRAQRQTLVDSLAEHNKFAEGLADDIFEVFDGFLENYKVNREADRDEPYEMLCTAVGGREALSDTERRFVEVMTLRLRFRKQRKHLWTARDRN